MSNAAVFPINMIRLCIDGYRDDLSGRAYNKMLLVPLPFSGYGALLLGMDDLFERVGYPQAFQVRRTFLKPGKIRGSIHIPAETMEDEKIGKQNGEYRTFDIVVQSRRQSGWQGILMDPERTYIKKFQSEMELLDYLCQDLDEVCKRKSLPEEKKDGAQERPDRMPHKLKETEEIHDRKDSGTARDARGAGRFL